jgi:hypothetical protein
LAKDQSVQELARLADPSGELLADLGRECAEAVSDNGGPKVGGSRPTADRDRRRKAEQPGKGTADRPSQS